MAPVTERETLPRVMGGTKLSPGPRKTKRRDVTREAVGR